MGIFFFFYTIKNHDLALFLSHLSYILSIVYLYSFLGFIYFFDTGRQIRIPYGRMGIFFGVTVFLVIVYFSPIITESMYLDDSGVYRENP